MQPEHDRKRQPDTPRREGGTAKRDESMTERGLGEDGDERDEARGERAREHDIARRQMPIHR